MDETQREITLEELLNEEDSEKKEKEEDTSYESSGKKPKPTSGVFLGKKTQLQKENSVPESMIKKKLFGASNEEPTNSDDEQQVSMKAKKNKNRKRKNKNKNKKKKLNPVPLVRCKTEVTKSVKEPDLKIPETSRQKDFLKAAPEPSCEDGWTAIPETVKKKKSRKKKNQPNKAKVDPLVKKKSLRNQNSLNTSTKNNSAKNKPDKGTQKKEPKAKVEKRKKPPKTMVDRISKSLVLQIVNLSVEKSHDQIKAKENEKQTQKQELPKTLELSKRIETKCDEEKEIKLITENEDSESCSLSVVPNQKFCQSTLNSERNSPSASTCIKLKKEDISLASHCKEDNFDQISQPYIEESKEKRLENLVVSSEEKKQT